MKLSVHTPLLLPVLCTILACAPHETDGEGDLREHDPAVGESMPEHGRWGGDDGQIFMLWADGTASAFSLHVQGESGRREARLTSPGGDKQLWTEYND